MYQVVTNKVARAERATIDKAAHTWMELKAFLEAKGESCPPTFLALDHFLQEGTQAPSGSLQALSWISKHAGVELELANLQLPERTGVTGASKGQAPSPCWCRSWRKEWRNFSRLGTSDGQRFW